MTELRAEPLSPIDAATLWPQLHRLGCEVLAPREGEHLLLAAGLATTGLAKLPRLPRTMVIGYRRGLSYRGILVARALGRGRAWEAVSLRLARDGDADVVRELVAAAGVHAAARGGVRLFLRLPADSAYRDAVRAAGLVPYVRERLLAPPAKRCELGPTPVRAGTRQDRAGVFRLYCRAVPEGVRRMEAASGAEWRAVYDSYDCEREFVLPCEGRITLWLGVGEREARLLVDPGGERPTVGELGVRLAANTLPRQGYLVLPEFDGALAEAAIAAGFVPVGEREVFVRRLARVVPLPETTKVPVSAVVTR